MAIVTFNSTTINNVLIHKNQLSDSDLAKLNANPNLMGKLALETTGATKTIPELDMVMDAGASADSYYMCSEKSGAYLVDSRVDYGATIVTNGTFDTDTNWTKNTGVTISGGEAVFTNVNNGSGIYQELIFTAGDYYVVNYDASITSGSLAAYMSGYGETITSSGSYSEVIKAGSGNNLVGVFSRTTTTTATIDNVSFRKATATEIANYASTVRTNADLQQKGIQTTAFVTDGAGVPTAYSSNLLQFNGDGRYVDTGWIPSGSFTIEIVQDFINDLNYHISGTNEGTVIGIGENFDNKVYVAVGASSLNSTSVAGTGIKHLMLTFDETTNVAISYLNNSQINSVVQAFTPPTESFIMGSRGLGVNFPLKSTFGWYRIHYKALSFDERATAYAQAKTIYPTLP